MREAVERSAVAAEARKWIGTPYHPCADIIGVGVDCGMLIVRVFVDVGLVPPFDPRPYPQDWHLHRSEERYLGFIDARLDGIKDPGVGDVIVFRYGRCFAHGAIVVAVDPVRIVHAYMRARSCLEEILECSSDLCSRERLVYSFWGN